MKRILSLIVLINLNILSFAQLHLDYSNYWHVLGVFNPAAITYQHDAGASGIARKQWVGLEGSPFGTEFLADFHSEKISTSFGMIGSYHSIGFMRNFNFRTQTAYRFKFSDDTYLQAGLDLGFATVSIQNAGWITGSQQPDPSIPANNSNDIGLTLGGGLFFNHPHFILSASSLLINQARLDEVNVRLTRHYNLVSAFKINFGEAGVFMPIAAIETDLTSTQYTFNLVSTYDDRLSAGIGIRFSDALIFTGSYSTKSIRFGYAYELTTSTLSQYSRGSHEVFVSWFLHKD